MVNGGRRANGETSISNCSTFDRIIWYVPCIIPVGVFIGHHEEYLKDSPGARTGCSPTTPGPFTSRTSSSASLMIQWRLTSLMVSELWFVIRTVYWKTHWPSSSLECSGEC